MNRTVHQLGEKLQVKIKDEVHTVVVVERIQTYYGESWICRDDQGFEKLITRGMILNN